MTHYENNLKPVFYIRGLIHSRNKYILLFLYQIVKFAILLLNIQEMEEGCDEDWQQDWQQHGSSESDWQLGSSDPPLYSSNWKPTIPSVHDNSQVC